MVSLYDLMMLQQQFSHLSTSIPSLDALFLSNMGPRHRVYDFQAGPGNSALYTVTASLVVSHLAHSPKNRAVVIDTLEHFPWHYLTTNPQFDQAWLDHNLVSYTADTFGKLMALLASPRLVPPGDTATTIVVINGFHELVEFYKLELSASYEEALLKSHLERNALFLSNQRQFQQAGTTSPLPELPPSSDLLTDSPAAKFDAHLHALLNLVSGVAFKHDLVCILLGHLDTAYKLDSASQDTSGATDTSQYSSKGRVVLAPALVGNRHHRNKVALESFITTRLVFYKDWYHNSVHYREAQERNDSYRENDREGYRETHREKHLPSRRVDPAALRTVYAVRVEHLQAMASETPTVFFDYDDIDYRL
ncbi:uncharacterized protein CANTADRAFT_36072, partial [Suhomyces tanzawaensis NRRL Y-17324]